MVYGQTAYNRTVYASGAVAPLASVRLGQSLRSFPRLTPAHFAGPGLAPQALIRAGKTSYTAGTLCDMPQMVTEYIKHIWHNKIVRVLNATETMSNIKNQGSIIFFFAEQETAFQQ
jgi:hypothetical protein